MTTPPPSTPASPLLAYANALLEARGWEVSYTELVSVYDATKGKPGQFTRVFVKDKTEDDEWTNR